MLTLQNAAWINKSIQEIGFASRSRSFTNSQNKKRTTEEIAKENGISRETVRRSTREIQHKLSNMFKGRVIDDVVADAKMLLQIWQTPYLRAEVERRFLNNNPFRYEEKAQQAWDYFVKHHAKKSNLTKTQIAKENDLTHSAVSMALKKALPVILEITDDFAQEIQTAPLMGVKSTVPVKTERVIEPAEI